ncbi:MAG TPA: hypothetical protein DEB31_06165 [Clostridiales bacterium]|nr:hypothetical protein [Clostridiales bacterium]
MSGRLHTFALAGKNLAARKFRTTGLIVIVAVFAFAVFCGSILIASTERGMESLSGRMGADLMAVPKGYENALTGSLLRSEPSTFYLESGLVETLAGLPGVERASSQLFIASLDAACCTVPVQLIGYDQDSDFTVSPWIRNSIKDDIGEGEVVVGSLILAEPGDEVIFYGQPYTVAAKLDETGMGFDSSVFMTKQTARDMIALSGETAVHPAGAEGDTVSCVMIGLAPDTDAGAVKNEIESRFSHVGVVAADSMMQTVASQLSGMTTITTGIIVLLFVVAVFVLVVVFAVTMNERKREFGLYRAFGATRKKLVGLVLAESLLVSLAGAVCGILTGSLILFPFQDLIAGTLMLPYLQPPPGALVFYILLSLGVAAVTGPIASVYSVARVAKSDTYLMIKENE